ncbi:MAG: STAS domain-containing protein [Planctomycetota bacterium]
MSTGHAPINNATTVVERHGSVTVVRPKVPLRSETIESIKGLVDGQLRAGMPLVVVDLSESPLIDGEGLEWLLKMDESCVNEGGVMRLCSAGELCRDILRITGVGRRLELFDDVTQALASFA